MAIDPIGVRIKVDRILCRDEGDSAGAAEPYLWTVFFKVDGTTVEIEFPGLRRRRPLTKNTPGSHGNLGVSNVGAGQTIQVPSSIGEWPTGMIPIPIPEALAPFTDDECVAGAVGVVCVLMEEDNVSDGGAEAGHVELNRRVAEALNEIVETRTFDNQEIDEDELDQFEKFIRSAVENAIKDHQDFLSNFWSLLNKDDFIGFRVFIFRHLEIAAQGVIDFAERWRKNGDWELFGRITRFQSTHLGFSRSRISFPKTVVGDIRTIGLTVSNRTVQDAVINVSAERPPFRWLTGSRSIQAGTELMLGVDFMPQGSGKASAVMTITNSLDDNEHTVSLTGEGLRGGEPL